MFPFLLLFPSFLCIFLLFFSFFFARTRTTDLLFAPLCPDLARTLRCAGEVRTERGEILQQNQTGAGFCLLFSKQHLKQHPRKGCDQPSIGLRRTCTPIKIGIVNRT